MDLIAPTDWLVFILVVGARFLLPLLIPFYPLPAIVLCLLLDGVDQTIFQVFTDLPLDGYQSYDKALDIYYLIVAYLSTFRNWSHLFAFRVSRFLLYYRLVGVVLFELTGLRALLILFPNTFEYFYIWYEAARLWWNPRRFSRVAVMTAAAGIWIVIKLPQEYWIHIAQRDVTDTIKALLGGGPETPWGPLLAQNALLIGVVLVVLVAAVWLLLRWLRTSLPPPDHALRLRADAHPDQPAAADLERGRALRDARIFDRDLFEKVGLISLLMIIFSEMLPTSNATLGEVVFNVALFVTVITALSHVLARRGTRVVSGLLHFAVVAAVSFGLIALTGWLFREATNWFNATIFVLLLSVIVTLYDRFQPAYLSRFDRRALFVRRTF
jgi:hypothetical protein